MGQTFAVATIIGSTASREYEFMVDTGSTYVGLPKSEIDGLGIAPIPDGDILVRTANEIINQQAYWTLGRIDGRGFACTVTEAPIPLIGYHMLQTMRYRVNPVTEALERIPDDEFAPPYMLLRACSKSLLSNLSF